MAFDTERLQRYISGMYRKTTETKGLPGRELLTENILLAGCFTGPMERLLLRLLWRANSNANVWIKEEHLAASLHVTTRSVRGTMRDLESMGLLEHRRPRKPQAGESGVYHLAVSAIRTAVSVYIEQHVPWDRRDPYSFNSGRLERTHGDQL
jgi:hypothetical protein